jgi:branched-chain amino acid transport system permease protein
VRLVFGSRQFLVILFAILALVPVLANPYVLFVSNQLLIYLILAIGLNIVFGYAGQFTLANAAVFGIGAYATSLLQLGAGLPYFLAAPAGAVTAMLIGTLVTLPALRLSGIYLALSTLSLAMFFQWVLLHWNVVTKGGGGFAVPHLDLGPLPIGPDIGIYWLSWITCALLTLFAWRLLRSRIGRCFVAIRDGEIAAQMLGIDLVRYKALAFAISGLYAGIAGALYAPLLGYVAPESFDLFQMIIQKCMIVVGGTGSLIGSVLGATIITLGLEVLREFKWTQEILFGSILIAFVLFQPGGVAVFLRRFAGWDEPLSAVERSRHPIPPRQGDGPSDPPVARQQIVDARP